MPRANKDRLYVALYARGGQAKMPGKEDTYHWALLIGPKEESGESRGYRVHAKDAQLAANGSTWVFEERESSMMATSAILVRIVIGKVTDRDRLFDLVRSVPVVQDDPEWNCVIWVKGALETLERDGKAVGTSKLGWRTVRDCAMEYVQQKKDAHRFDGQVQFDTRWPATYDLLEKKELIK